MTYKLDFELPPELEVYRDKIEASIEPYLELKITENGNPTWWQSKFCGHPYLPKNCDYPKSWDGQYLYLLAQINFAEIPSLKDFPETGILQFYIGDNGLYGCDFDKPKQQNYFRILYFPALDLREDNLITDFSFLPKFPNIPVTGCCAVEAIERYDPMCIADYYFYNFSPDEIEMASEIFNFIDKLEEKELEKDIYEDIDPRLFADEIHKIGGHAQFTQGDFRPFLPEAEENYSLLFQMVTDGNKTIDIMWGDAGIGNFFIRRSMLIKLDFSDVIYHWDCG